MCPYIKPVKDRRAFECSFVCLCVLVYVLVLGLNDVYFMAVLG